jgi:ATP-dependent Lon protease
MPQIRLDFSLPTDLPETLPVLPLRQGVLLPGGLIPLTVGRPGSVAAAEAADEWILVAVQRRAEDDPGADTLLPVATLARIADRTRDRRGHLVLVVNGVQRVRLGDLQPELDYLEAAFERLEQSWPETVEAEALARSLRENVREAAERMGLSEQVPLLMAAAPQPWLFADVVASVIDAPPEWQRKLLVETDPLERTREVLGRVIHLKNVLDAQKSIQEKVVGEQRDLQKEHILRRQLKAIQEELGETDEDSDLTQLRERLAARALPEEVRGAVNRELKRLDRISPQSPERNVAVDWLTWVADLPWAEYAAKDVDLGALEEALDKSHHGLADVKRQVQEHLAVRKLAGSGRADVLLLVGPPGVGKTSIGQAIADATGRELVRVALGGVRDQSELRGHRRTYIGSRPGRIIEGLRRAGSADPVILLDEVDKLVRGGFGGDPAAALLEVLDPEQNDTFTDHYMEVPFDLSKALFIATANDLSAIPGPLRDRMEVIDIPGYTAEEKVVIAREHLLTKLAKNTGLAPEQVVLPDPVIEAVIAGWTAESGVRQLQRALGRVFRAAAVKVARGELSGAYEVAEADLPRLLGKRRFVRRPHEEPSRAGIATGLAWTPVGGDVLYVEASSFPGSGRLVLTGQLGEVMKESARAALTYVLSEHRALGIPVERALEQDLHVHVPAGATPKDGPSAGVTMFTAIASLLSGRPVRGDVAMTGEATLRGRVLPVGGIKSKVLAAHRRGIKRIILPRHNEHDLEDVPQHAKDELEFILVDHMSEVLEAALEPGAAAPVVVTDDDDGEVSYTVA